MPFWGGGRGGGGGADLWLQLLPVCCVCGGEEVIESKLQRSVWDNLQKSDSEPTIEPLEASLSDNSSDCIGEAIIHLLTLRCRVTSHQILRRNKLNDA